MIVTAILAASLAYLVAADRESKASHCGSPIATAQAVLLFLAIGFAVLRTVFRLLVFAIRHPS